VATSDFGINIFRTHPKRKGGKSLPTHNPSIHPRESSGVDSYRRVSKPRATILCVESPPAPVKQNFDGPDGFSLWSTLCVLSGWLVPAFEEKSLHPPPIDELDII